MQGGSGNETSTTRLQRRKGMPVWVLGKHGLGGEVVVTGRSHVPRQITLAQIVGVVSSMAPQ